MMLNSSRDTYGLTEGHLPDANLKIGAQLPHMIVWLCIKVSIFTRKYGEKRNF